MNYSWQCRICDTMVEEGNNRCPSCNSRAELTTDEITANKRHWKKYGRLAEGGAENFKTVYKNHLQKSVFMFFTGFFFAMISAAIVAMLVSTDGDVFVLVLLAVSSINMVLVLFFLPRLLKSECPKCNEKQMTCQVWFTGLGYEAVFKCRNCDFSIDWKDGLGYDLRQK